MVLELIGVLTHFFSSCSPLIESKMFKVNNGSEIVWSNKTIEWTYKYYVFAVDGGSPKRGDRIPLTISFNATCVKTAKIVVNETSGEVFFRVPTMTGSEYRKHSCIISMTPRGSKAGTD